MDGCDAACHIERYLPNSKNIDLNSIMNGKRNVYHIGLSDKWMETPKQKVNAFCGI